MFSHFLRKLGSVVGRGIHRPDGSIIESSGWTWHVEPGAESILGPEGLDLAAWERDGRGEVVKQNLQRTITRVRLPGGTVFVKRCRANTPRALAREILRPPKARLEFENALLLRSRGLSTVEPLAWGAPTGPWPGESVLVTREQAGAIPFVDYLERILPTLSPTAGRPVRRQIARGFALFMAQLHDAGVAHPDPHPGNVLVELSPTRPPRFFLMDLHAVRIGQPLSWAEARDNLTLLNRYFQVRGTRADRLRFWRSYVAARGPTTAREANQFARDVEDATTVSNNRFWAGRTGRYLGNNRDSRKVRGPEACGYAVRDLPADVVAGWLADPDAAIRQPGVRIVKDSRTSTVAVVPVGTGPGRIEVIYKRFNLRSPYGVFKNLVRRSPALRSWLLGNGARDRGIPTARVLAVFHRRSFGISTTGYAVFEQVPGAIGLPEAVAGLEHYRPADRRRILACWADRLGRTLRTMHDREMAHRDLKAPNILMAGAATNPFTASPVLIDLVGAEAGRPVSDAARIRDLARLAASFLNQPLVGRGDHLRLLRAYLGRGDWKSWWQRVARVTRAKAGRNARAGRPLG